VGWGGERAVEAEVVNSGEAGLDKEAMPAVSMPLLAGVLLSGHD
jgi:hypothetical protein